jgi:hypothetical protein
MHETIEDAVTRSITSRDEQQTGQEEQETPGTSGQETQPDETIHIHYFPDAIVILKEENGAAQEDDIIEATLVETKQPPVFIAYTACAFYLFLVLSCIAFQVYEILNPPIATVTIIPKSQTVTLTGTVRFGRVLPALTLSQSQTVATTGKGHQDARRAAGSITLYNGQFSEQTVAAGTILTGADGIQVITDQDAVIPKASPPVFGQARVSAHAIHPGVKGNIPADDIQQACCASAVLAKNTASFTGGQDQRDFHTVEPSDIDATALPLKTTLAHSMQGALQSQLTAQEHLSILSCPTAQTADHRTGQEATTVKVTVAETCSAVAYNPNELAAQATALLSHQAVTTLGAAYSLFGEARVEVTQAYITHTPASLVFLSFHAQGIWIYALSQRAQQQIKQLLAGKTKQAALHILWSLPGIADASIAWADVKKLPTDTRNIHTVFIIGADQ